MNKLTHIGLDGRARMVDVSSKPNSQREALASGKVQMAELTLNRAISRNTTKGDPIAIAELAGIMAAKRTADIIPLCHPLTISGVQVSIEQSSTTELSVQASVKTSGQTGVEMEALSAVSAACLTLYDMLKAIDKSMIISDIKLLEKTGGQTGTYKRDNP